MTKEYIWQFIKYPLILISLKMFRHRSIRIAKEVNHELNNNNNDKVHSANEKKEENKMFIHLIDLRRNILIQAIKSQLKYHSPVGNSKLAECKCIAKPNAKNNQDKRVIVILFCVFSFFALCTFKQERC